MYIFKILFNLESVHQYFKSFSSLASLVIDCLKVWCLKNV